MSELNFHRANTLYATHSLHAFAAKCPPQLAEWAIHKYSTTGDVVCDPMAGSGTTLIEAWRHGRTSCGFDIDPLACLIARAKTTPVSDRPFRDANRAACVEAVCRNSNFRTHAELTTVGKLCRGVVKHNGAIHRLQEPLSRR